jgi:hypothetical protein
MCFPRRNPAVFMVPNHATGRVVRVATRRSTASCATSGRKILKKRPLLNRSYPSEGLFRRTATATSMVARVQNRDGASVGGSLPKNEDHTSRDAHGRGARIGAPRRSWRPSVSYPRPPCVGSPDQQFRAIRKVENASGRTCGLSILRFSAYFRMLGLPMSFLRRGSEGTEPKPLGSDLRRVPTQMLRAALPPAGRHERIFVGHFLATRDHDVPPPVRRIGWKGTELYIKREYWRACDEGLHNGTGRKDLQSGAAHG